MLNNMKMVDKEMKSAKESHYKESQELYRLRAEEADSNCIRSERLKGRFQGV